MKYQLQKRFFLVSVLALFIATSIAQQTSLDEFGELVDGVQNVSAEEASQILTSFPEVRVLDVRTGFEYRRGHIKNAVNLNYYSLFFRTNLDELDKDTIWLVHCKVGVRSSKTLPMMKKLGFKNIIHMTHGIDEWRKAGLNEVKD
ncbi:MAG: rhodanese-like domain-containing protein [Granulosicoccus sp.]|nr:rhodanese-like domain-containing protein [Granulosicoccus sp.]